MACMNKSAMGQKTFKKSHSILFLTDWSNREHEVFRKAISKISENRWDYLRYKRRGKFKRDFRFVRWVSYFMLALKGLRNHRRYHIVVAYQQLVGTILCLLKEWFGLEVRVIILTFLLYPDKGWLALIKNYFIRVMLKQSECIVCYSSVLVEILCAKFPAYTHKVNFVRLGNLLGDERTRGCEYSERFAVFSGGSSHRDYKTFFEAVREIREPVAVSCFANDIKGLDIPKNVKLFLKRDPIQYQNLLFLSDLVVIPMKDENSSAGQLTILQSMALGKAIIATRGQGLLDYARDGEEVRLIGPRDVNILRKTILELLENSAERQRLGLQAKSFYTKHLTPEKYASAINKLVTEMIQSTQRIEHG